MTPARFGRSECLVREHYASARRASWIPALLLAGAACADERRPAPPVGPGAGSLTSNFDSGSSGGGGVPDPPGGTGSSGGGSDSGGGGSDSGAAADSGGTTTGLGDDESGATTGSTTAPSDSDSSSTGGPPGYCGDGSVDPGEACDDGNLVDTDSCIHCVAATCGDGLVWAGVEDCDDQDGDDLDRCRNDCTFHRVTDLALGGNHTCALFNSGRAKCWGNAHSGRTGHGHEDDIGDDEPASAADFLDMGDTLIQLVAGIGHTCGLHPGGGVRCFGRAIEGQLGWGDTVQIGDDEAPSAYGTVPIGPAVTFLNTRGGAFHTCARLTTGATKCWGLGSASQLGVVGQFDTIGDDETAAAGANVDLGGDPIALAMGNAHSCALLDGPAGNVRCWGAGNNGALGYGNADTVGDDESPADAGNVPIGGRVVALTAGWYHTCALLDTGNVRCWGRGNNGRLGYGTQAWVGINNTPADVGDVPLGTPVTEIAAGLAHTCARLTDGTARCWGWGGLGQLGTASTENIGDNEHPQDISTINIGAPITRIAADGNHTCAITTEGHVRCWGDPGDGRLGYGNLNPIGDDESPATAGNVPLLNP